MEITESFHSAGLKRSLDIIPAVERTQTILKEKTLS
jgi:hypothetical protein